MVIGGSDSKVVGWGVGLCESRLEIHNVLIYEL